MKITTATTDQSVRFSAFGADGAGVTLTSASAALAVYYQRWLKGVRLSETQVTPITDLASVGAAHADGGIIHDADGSHRLDLPDAAFAAGCDEVRLRITATDITGGIAHERFSVGAAVASQASVDAVAEDVGSLTSNGGVASTAPARRAGNRVEVEIVRGDTYADGLANGALDFDEQAWWPADLAGATITLTARYRRGRHDTTDPAVVLTKAGTVVSATTPQEVRIELTAAETAAATVGTHEYDVQATLSTGEVVTLAGPGWPFVVRADQTV